LVVGRERSLFRRTAIARALALDPKLFLLDEPLSALDAKLREAMQVELRLLQQRLGVTTIVVTHDQREAMTMADLVVVMDHGRVQQVGAPLEIYRRPANAFVADFIGLSNLLKGTFRRGAVEVDGRAVRAEALPPGLAEGSPVTLSVRPEETHVLPAGTDGENRLPGEVAFVRDLGASFEVTARCVGHELLVVMTPRERPPESRHRQPDRGRAAPCCLRDPPGMTAEEHPRGWAWAAFAWPAAMLGVFFLIPFGIMLAVSFYHRVEGAFYEPAFELANYARFLTPFFGRVLPSRLASRRWRQRWSSRSPFPSPTS
jgi:hypothetical protein